MKETMTVHKALSELKTINSRIDKELNAAEFVVTNKHSNTKISGIPVAEYLSDMKDAYKSIRTLINRRNAIKRAVTKSNAVTMVKIGDQEYTVAEAIDMKNVGMNAMQNLVARIENQYALAKKAADRRNGDELDRRADEYVRSLYENADMKNMSAEVKKTHDDFMEAQMVDVLDPINAQKTTKELNDYIDGFLSEVDSALSVSNALTTVEVEYETV